ncbi:uncharacterized protein V1518DRAFT_415602 [Limtongia smithiae]|uniref:uncharacterized protein n=1 Tax=Limtongia smithiae TaxID=1125753 RepID=UPI0034CF7D8B
MCPHCRRRDIQTPWWTAENTGWVQEFQIACPSCGASITKDGLAGLQLLQDFRKLSIDGIPMKGTLLDFLGIDERRMMTYPGFANEVMGKVFGMERLILAPGEGLSTLRTRVNEMVEDKERMLKQNFAMPLHRDHQIPLRRMLAAYDENTSQFSVELEAAVVRQFNFVNAMNALAYLASPFQSATINRSVDRLIQFLYLVQNSLRPLAPPVDVDLAWHTFQLNPAAYLAACLVLTGSYIDHDDGIGSPALTDATRAADKVWRKQFPADPLGYDGCTCAFCEAEREFTTHSNGASLTSGRRLMSRLSPRELRDGNGSRVSAGDKIDQFYGMACENARRKGMRGIVRLGPQKPGVYKHPYYAAAVAGADGATAARHTTALNKARVRCVTLTASAGVSKYVDPNQPQRRRFADGNASQSSDSGVWGCGTGFF